MISRDLVARSMSYVMLRNERGRLGGGPGSAYGGGRHLFLHPRMRLLQLVVRAHAGIEVTPTHPCRFWLLAKNPR